MFIRVSITDLLFIPAIGAASWYTNDHSIGWAMWIGFGAYALGHLSQYVRSQ